MDQQNQQPYYQPPPQPGLHDNTAQMFLPTKNMPALWAYYMGVFGLIPFFGLPLSVAAIVLGASGLKRFKANPTPGAKGHALAGLIMGIAELSIFAIFILLLIVGSMAG